MGKDPRIPSLPLLIPTHPKTVISTEGGHYAAAVEKPASSLCHCRSLFYAVILNNPAPKQNFILTLSEVEWGRIP
jgi:hypothetical protein